MRIDLKRYAVSSERAQFMLPEDLYAGWVILAPRTGSFTFTLTSERLPGGADVSGVCEFGEMVICPPGATLRRSMLVPTAFYFAEFLSGAAFPVGKVIFQDVRRLSSTYAYIAEVNLSRLGTTTNQMTHLVEDLLFMASREGASSGPDDPLARQAAAHIEQHACAPGLSLQDLAADLGISASRLTHRFRAAYGTTPVVYATEVRLSQARRMLVETNETLAVIAARCGYQTPFYFSRIFTHKVGMGPSVYRRRYRI